MARPRKEEAPKVAKKLTEQQFLEQNPEATSYQMLLAGVITEERYNEINRTPAGVKVEVKEVPNLVKPRLTQISNPYKVQENVYESNRDVVLVEKSSGKRTSLSLVAAKKELIKYPNKFIIE